MRCCAYMLPAEVYADLEAQILENLRDGDLQQLGHLLGDSDLTVDLLSGEWRVMMSELEDHYQVIDPRNRLARMVVSPAELEEFVDALRNPERQERWRPVSFGLAELTDALPAGTDLEAVVFTEEDDDWLWQEPVYELVAIRPDVFELLEVHIRAAMEVGDWRAMARFAEDHAEGSVEFSPEQWRVLMRHSGERVPELMSIYRQKLSTPNDYTSIREALSLVADPRYQPSLDAWLRVHAEMAQYALYFRDASLERREVEGSGLFRLAGGHKTAKMKRIPGPGEEPPLAGVSEPDAKAEGLGGNQTVPLRAGERLSLNRSVDEED